MKQQLYEWMPCIVAAVAVACSCSLFGQSPVDGAILALGFCAPALLGARLLQSAYLSWGRSDVSARVTSRRLLICKLGGVCVVLAFLLVMLREHEGGVLGPLERLCSILLLLIQAAVVAGLLAITFEWSGSTRVELDDALSKNHTSYSEGAAWSFFLGYLVEAYGDNTKRFPVRMDDYMSANDIKEEDHTTTYREKFVILLPMKLNAILSDDKLEINDRTVEREKELKVNDNEGKGGRKFGETYAYKVRQGSDCYRVAMEEATAMRTAAFAVEDDKANFDMADYEAFAVRFETMLRKILEDKPNIGSQVELVPIYRTDQIGSRVVKHLRDLQRRQEQEQNQG